MAIKKFIRKLTRLDVPKVVFNFEELPIDIALPDLSPEARKALETFHHELLCAEDFPEDFVDDSYSDQISCAYDTLADFYNASPPWENTIPFRRPAFKNLKEL